MPIAANLLPSRRLSGLRLQLCSHMGLPMPMHWEQCLLPPPGLGPMLRSVFLCNLCDAFFQDISYEPECQVWRINNDLLQPSVLS